MAAAYNLSLHTLKRITLHRQYMGNFCQGITPLFKGPIEVLFVLMPVASEELHVDMYVHNL